MRRFLPLLPLLLTACSDGPDEGELAATAKPASTMTQAGAAAPSPKAPDAAPPAASSPSAPTQAPDLPADPLAGFILFRDDVTVDYGLAYRHAGTLEDPIPIDVDFLGAWEFDENADPPFPPYVLEANGKKVKITGFMLPDIDFEHIREFHMVRSLWGCCFGAPPRLNELVLVKVPGGEGMDYTYNNVEVIGTLQAVFEMEDGVVEDLYRIHADHVRVLDEFEDPEAPESFDPVTGFKGVVPEEAF